MFWNNHIKLNTYLIIKTFAEKFYFHVERFVIMRKKMVPFVLVPWGKCTMYTVCTLNISKGVDRR